MGKNFVRCMEMYGVEVKDEVSWVGDIFGCKQKIIFGRVRIWGRWVQMITSFGISYGEYPRVVGVLRSLWNFGSLRSGYGRDPLGYGFRLGYGVVI
jgi:hypothetical protein